VSPGEGFDLLDAPIKRVTAPNTPVPFGPGLEAAYMPNAEDIREAVLSL
jgi:acetoin:2,6-dichlorophenolindophenol oxidoreductase subunit beta